VVLEKREPTLGRCPGSNRLDEATRWCGLSPPYNTMMLTILPATNSPSASTDSDDESDLEVLITNNFEGCGGHTPPTRQLRLHTVQARCGLTPLPPTPWHCCLAHSKKLQIQPSKVTARVLPRQHHNMKPLSLVLMPEAHRLLHAALSWAVLNAPTSFLRRCRIKNSRLEKGFCSHEELSAHDSAREISDSSGNL